VKSEPDSNAIENDRALWRAAVLPSIVIAILGVAIASFFRGRPGFWGALLAGFTVILFFSVHLAVSRLTRELDPIATMALAMFSYFAKVILMGAFLLIVTKTTSKAAVDRPSFAACALTITAVWLAGEIRAFLKLRFQLPLPPKVER
jgi:ATP synthase protein I